MKTKIFNMRGIHQGKTLPICFGFCFIWVGLFTFTAKAENLKKRRHIPTEKIIEFSLLNLKKKLDKTVQENEQLTLTNRTLHKEINSLRRILENLAIQKSQLSGHPLSFYVAKNQNLSSDAILQGRENRTKELISYFERGIRKLREDVSLLDNKLESEWFEAKQSMLIKKKAEGRKSILQSEKKLKTLSSKSKGPLKKIESLKMEKKALDQTINDLESMYQ